MVFACKGRWKLKILSLAIACMALCIPVYANNNSGRAAQASGHSIIISQGGVYSGNWESDDPSVPAVYVHTDAPVVIRNASVGGRGDLIAVHGVKTGANLRIENVKGVALDPGVPGKMRGSFLSGGYVNSLIVQHCTMTGVSFGVKLVGARPAQLQIANNLALNLEDRASDGKGGLLAARPALGHFVLLDAVIAGNGAEIAWNEVLQTMGQSSVEDVINLYSSQGTAAHPIQVHDNYMEGASSPSRPEDYTGIGIITDGTTARGNPPTAYVLIENNQIVKTAGGGVAISAGHDIQAKNNRVVSCGMTEDGKWYASKGIAAYIWNYYRSDIFYNNKIEGTSGGMLNPDVNHKPVSHNLWVNKPDVTSASIGADGNSFTDPCMVNGQVNLHAEDAERLQWRKKLSATGQTVGVQSTDGASKSRGTR